MDRRPRHPQRRIAEEPSLGGAWRCSRGRAPRVTAGSGPASPECGQTRPSPGNPCAPPPTFCAPHLISSFPYFWFFPIFFVFFLFLFFLFFLSFYFFPPLPFSFPPSFLFLSIFVSFPSLTSFFRFCFPYLHAPATYGVSQARDLNWSYSHRPSPQPQQTRSELHL